MSLGIGFSLETETVSLVGEFVQLQDENGAIERSYWELTRYQQERPYTTRRKPRGHLEVMGEFVALMQKGYRRFTIRGEDSLLCSPSVGHLVGFNAFDGERGETKGLTMDELTAVVALTLGNDEHPDANDLYPFAEKVIAEWPASCRPMP